MQHLVHQPLHEESKTKPTKCMYTQRASIDLQHDHLNDMTSNFDEVLYGLKCHFFLILHFT